MAYLLDRLSGHVSGVGARNGDIHVGQFRIDMTRPWVIRWSVIHRTCFAAGCAIPAIAAKLAQRTRRPTVYDRLHIVKRAIGLAIGITAAFLIARMRGRVPAAMGQIQPAHKCDRVINHDYFLMMRRAHGMLLIEAKAQPPVSEPIQLVKRKPLTVHREYHREIPRQHAHAQLLLALDHRIQKVAELFGQPVIRPGRHQPDTTVDIPPQDEDAAFGLRNGRAHRAKIVVRIDEKCHTPRAVDAPAIATGNEQPQSGIGFGCIHEPHRVLRVSQNGR